MAREASDCGATEPEEAGAAGTQLTSVFSLADIAKTPFKGVGKPEPLKGDLSGWWSRRITLEHRLVYRVEKGVIYVLQARYHY